MHFNCSKLQSDLYKYNTVDRYECKIFVEWFRDYIGELLIYIKKSRCGTASHIKTSPSSVPKLSILAAPRRSVHQVCRMRGVDADTTFSMPNWKIISCIIGHSSGYSTSLVSGPIISWIHPIAATDRRWFLTLGRISFCIILTITISWNDDLDDPSPYVLDS
jgi:hypothetical protein